MTQARSSLSTYSAASPTQISPGARKRWPLVVRPTGMLSSTSGKIAPSYRQMIEVSGRTQRNGEPGQRIDLGQGNSAIAVLIKSGNTSAAGRPERLTTAK